MPLPWLIGAAVVAVGAAVVKAISDNDDSTSSSESDDAERREQEREAQRQRKHDRLSSQLANLKKDRLEEARELLARSAEALGQSPEVKIELRETPSSRAVSWPGSSIFAGPALGSAVSAALIGFQTQTGEQPNNTVDLHTFEAALESVVQATSAYAQGTGSILDLAGHSQGDFNLEERGQFLVNLQMLESLYGPIPFGSKGLQDLTALREVRRRLDNLQNLKQQLEQQG